MNKRALLNNTAIVLSLILIISILLYGVFVTATVDIFTLTSPENNTFTNDTTPDFQFTATGNSSTYNCTLYIDDAANELNESVTNNVSTTITANSTLSEISHSWYINCTDADGINLTTPRTLTIDITPPVIDYAASTTASGNYSNITVFINITCTDTNKNSTILNWNGTDEPFDTTIGNMSFSIKDNLSGYYTFYAWCNDSAGNINQTTITTIEIDSTPPAVSNVSVSDVSITAADVSGPFYVFIDYDSVMNATPTPIVTFSPALTSSLTSCNSSWLNITRASYNCTIVDANESFDEVNITITSAIDLAGNVQFSNTSVAVFVIDTLTDVVVPNVTLLSPGNGTLSDVVNGSFGLNFTASDNAALLSCDLFFDDVLNQSLVDNVSVGVDTAFVVDDVSEGNHSWYVNCTDGFNVASSEMWYFTVDNTKPLPTGFNILSATIITDADIGTLFNFDFDWDEPMDTGVAFDVINYVSALTSCTFSWINSTSSEYNCTIADYNETVLEYNLTITTAQDLAGNIMDSYTFVAVFDLDMAAPLLSIDSPVDGYSYNVSDVDFNFTVSGQDVCWYSLDDADVVNLSGCDNTTLLNLSEDVHSLVLFANDSASNIANQTRSFTVDTSAPVPNSSFVLSHPTIAESNVSQLFNFTFYWDDVMNTSVNASINVSGISNTLASCNFSWIDSTTSQYLCSIADYNETVVGVDISVSGAVSDVGLSQSSTYTFTDKLDVDSVAPTVSISSPASNSLIGGSSYLITGSATDVGVGVDTLKLFVDDSYANDITVAANWSYSWNLGGGTYNLSVEACDTLGNCQNSTSKTNITVDLTAPVTVNSSVFSGWNNTFNITLTANDSDDVAYTSYKIDGLSWQNGTNIIINNNTNISSNTEVIVYYYSVDTLGNREDNKSFNVSFDKTAPVTSAIGYTPEGNDFMFNIWTNDAALVNLTGSDSHSGYNETRYCTNSSTCTPYLVWNETLNITAPGITYLRYRSMDNITNLESIQTKKIMILYNNISYINESNTINENNTIIIIAENSTDNGTIIVPPNINASLDLNELLNDTTNNVTLPVEINVSSNTSNGLVLVLLPGHIILSGNSSWLGYFNLPRSSSNSVIIDPDSGKTVDTSSIKVIELGADDIELLSNNTVRINFSGKAGRYAGYFKNGEYYQITTTCTMNNLTWADSNLASNGSCKITVGNDIIILTKHFTKFVTYTQSTVVSPSSRSSGGGGGVAGLITSATLSFGYQNLAAGTKKLTLSSTGIPLYELSVTTNVALTDVLFKITKTDTPSAAYNGRAYKYVQIDHTGAPDPTINTAKMLFKVEKSWLTSNNLEAKDIQFLRYVNGWTATTVRILSNDSTYVYYEATSPGLSLFAIAAEGAPYIEPVITPEPVIESTPEPITPVTGNVVEEKTTDAGVTAVKTVSNVSTNNEASPITRFIIAALSLIVLVLVLYFVYNRRRNEM